MKKRYLCPVCDQELTAKSYCPECRRIRKAPLIYEGWLLPNESEPEGQQKASRGSGREHAYGVPNKDPHKKKRGSEREKAVARLNGVVVVSLLLCILIVGAVVFQPLKEFAGELIDDIRAEFGAGDSPEDPEELSEALEPGENETELSGDGPADGYSYLSEEEVVAAGEPCNGYCHYETDGEEYLERLCGYTGELWAEWAPEVDWQESSNQVYRSKEELYSYYRREARLFLENGVYYTVVCDTATGEVMEVTVGAETEEEFGPAFLLAVCALEPERDRNGVWSEIGSLLSAMEGEEYYFGDWGIHEVYLSGGTSYYGSLACLPQYDKYQ